MIKPQDLLTQFGLSPQEAEMYLVSLAAGPTPVSIIAKKSSKTRTAAYFHITNLLEKGILKESRVKGKRLIIALPPQELALRFDRLTTELKSIVPHLEAMNRVDIEKPIIHITESKKGFYEIYDVISSLPLGSQFRIFEGSVAMKEEFKMGDQDHWQTFFSRIVERKIATKALFTTEAIAVPGKKLSPENLVLFQKRIWDRRTISESIVPFKDMFLIYGNTVAFVFPQLKLVMTIQHESIANALTAIFDGLFSFSVPIVKA